MGKRLGKAIIKIDGQSLETMPGASLDIGGVTRTTLVGDHKVQGQFETPKQSRLECEISVGTQTRLSQMRGWEDVTISMECDTGQQYVVQGAWLLDPAVLKTNEGGRVPLVFEGPPAEELV